MQSYFISFVFHLSSEKQSRFLLHRSMYLYSPNIRNMNSLKSVRTLSIALHVILLLHGFRLPVTSASTSCEMCTVIVHFVKQKAPEQLRSLNIEKELYHACEQQLPQSVVECNLVYVYFTPILNLLQNGIDESKVCHLVQLCWKKKTFQIRDISIYSFYRYCGVLITVLLWNY